MLRGDKTTGRCTALARSANHCEFASAVCCWGGELSRDVASGTGKNAPHRRRVWRAGRVLKRYRCPQPGSGGQAEVVQSLGDAAHEVRCEREGGEYLTDRQAGAIALESIK